MLKKTWLVVANSNCARIFEIEKDLKLKELETLIHPESKLRDSDLVSAR